MGSERAHKESLPLFVVGKARAYFLSLVGSVLIKGSLNALDVAGEDEVNKGKTATEFEEIETEQVPGTLSPSGENTRRNGALYIVVKNS